MSEGDPLRRLTGLLADGRFHSGQTLAITLGVGRSTIWNYIRALRRAGLEIFAVRRRGYRLARPLELLARERILAAMSPASRGRLRAVETLFTVDSTNQYLADAARDDGLAAPVACLAEAQSAGRGRRGREWISPLASNLYLSLLWQLDAPPGGPGALGLAVGVAAARTLESFALEGVELKWPNDLIWGGAKLGGILIEISGEPRGPLTAIIGIGMNMSMPDAAGTRIDQSWTDLGRALGEPPSRNTLAGRLLESLMDVLDRFERSGFAAFEAEWSRRDAMRDCAVELYSAEGSVAGIARGINRGGALLVEVDGVAREVTSGDVTLRACGGAR